MNRFFSTKKILIFYNSGANVVFLYLSLILKLKSKEWKILFLLTHALQIGKCLYEITNSKNFFLKISNDYQIFLKVLRKHQ